MAAPDFTSHNEEAQTVWAAYRAGRPLRVPVTLCADTRFFILDDEFNPGREAAAAIDFEAVETAVPRAAELLGTVECGETMADEELIPECPV